MTERKPVQRKTAETITTDKIDEAVVENKPVDPKPLTEQLVEQNPEAAIDPQTGAVTTKDQLELKEEVSKAAAEDESVVLYVDHGTYWPGVGNLAKGYNLVKPGIAKLWLDKGWARKASAAEVKKHYGL